jgi:hypothetical protein
MSTLLWPKPLDCPLGECHHCDVPLTPEDVALGSHLAKSMGTLYGDVGELSRNKKAAYGRFFYYISTPRNEWARVARALRIHGLAIVTAKTAAQEKNI